MKEFCLEFLSSIQHVLIDTQVEFPCRLTSLCIRRVLLSSHIRFCVLEVTIKNNALRLIGVYAERPDLSRRINRPLTASPRAVLAGDWNTVIDTDEDSIGVRSGTNIPDVKPFRDFS